MPPFLESPRGANPLEWTDRRERGPPPLLLWHGRREKGATPSLLCALNPKGCQGLAPHLLALFDEGAHSTYLTKCETPHLPAI